MVDAYRAAWLGFYSLQDVTHTFSQVAEAIYHTTLHIPLPVGYQHTCGVLTASITLQCGNTGTDRRLAIYLSV